MIEWLDRLFNKYAQIIIKIADFFGIDNNRLPYVWCMITITFYFCPINLQDLSLTGLTILRLFFVLGLYLVSCIAIYTETNNTQAGIFSKIHHPTNRVFLIILLALGSVVGLNKHPCLMILIGKLILPMALWIYFLNHPDLRCKKRLKDMVKSVIKKAKEAITIPNPIPSPVPAPVSAIIFFLFHF